MWVWAIETQLNPKELKKNLFLAKNKYGLTAWHQAALNGSLKSMQTLRSLVKDAELNTDELLLISTADGYTAFQLAARKNHVETLKKMWLWAEETELNPKELKKNLFLAKDNDGYIAWHLAALNGCLEALEAIRCLVKEAELNTDELLLVPTADGYTAFQLEAHRTTM